MINEVKKGIKTISFITGVMALTACAADYYWLGSKGYYGNYGARTYYVGSGYNGWDRMNYYDYGWGRYNRYNRLGWGYYNNYYPAYYYRTGYYYGF